MFPYMDSLAHPRVRIITSGIFTDGGSIYHNGRYPIDYYGRAHRQGEVITEIEIHDQKAVRFNEGSSQYCDTLTILDLNGINELGSERVIA